MDRDVHQWDSFAKYAAAFLICPVRQSPASAPSGVGGSRPEHLTALWWWKSPARTLYPGVKAVGGGIETCFNAGNRMATINKQFDCFNFKLFRIKLTAQGHLPLSHLKCLRGFC